MLRGNYLGMGRDINAENILHNVNFFTLLTDFDVARVCGMSVSAVRRWRQLRIGPKYFKLGSSVRYKPEDLRAWIESRPSGCGAASHTSVSSGGEGHAA